MAEGLKWGFCGACYWFKKKDASLCADQRDKNHACGIGQFRPRKLSKAEKRKTKRQQGTRGGA
jgi:hypothetical protein